jgi:hypothetical protein
MSEQPDKPEHAFHLTHWRIAPGQLNREGTTSIIDANDDRVIAEFHGEDHKENAKRVMKALTAPETRKREAVNFAIRDQLRITRNLKKKLTTKHEDVEALVFAWMHIPDFPRDAPIEGLTLSKVKQVLLKAAHKAFSESQKTGSTSP